MKQFDFLLNMAVGDAYAFAGEFVKDVNHLEQMQNLDKYYHHPHNRGPGIGCYTDDTQMTIANIKVLLNHHPFEEWKDKNIWIQSWIDTFNENKKNDTYSKRMFKALSETKEAKDFIIDNQSDKNGAAMRAIPLGVVSNIYYLLYYNHIQASITHSGRGIIASHIIALLSHYFIYKIGSRKEVDEFLITYLSPEIKNEILVSWGDQKVVWQDAGMNTAKACLELIKTENSMSSILKRLLGWDGDTDSVAAISLGLATLVDDIENDLPKFMYEDLEKDSEYGYDYLKNFGKSFFNYFL